MKLISLLETAGEPFEPVLVKLHKGEQNSAEYRAINHRGQVPVLVDGDTTITQILAIVGYLDAKFPDRHFLPSEPLARFYGVAGVTGTEPSPVQLDPSRRAGLFTRAATIAMVLAAALSKKAIAQEPADTA